MNLQIETRMGDQVERYLDLAAVQAKLTAANMANIDTPGYRTVGMNFDAEMRKALTGVDAGTEPEKVGAEPVDGLVTRPDGNNVSMDRESLKLADAQLKFRTGVALLRLQNQTVLDAIHADGK